MTNQLYPDWTISVQFKRLTDEESRKILGFCALQKGALLPFLWLDPKDYQVKGIQLPMVSPGKYQAVMQVGEYVEPAAYIENATVYRNDAKVPASDYTITDGVIVFKTAPAGSDVIKADYTYYWKVCFDDDGLGITELFRNWNETGSIKLRVVR
nr:MAG TPA: minor tail protein [Caudoviricetes sp.]DAX26294.1 MAG TPA: minor tail protein [Caudoviricetes sp.]